ncbi:MAG: DUF4760 domain-containing protein [Nitrososphaeraceae archaeon]
MDLIAILSSKEAIAAYIAIAGVIVSYITYRFNTKQLKQNQLSELIKSLNNPSHREARKVIYDHYDQKQISNISFQLLEIDRNQFGEYVAEAKDAIIIIAKNIVRSDLNHAGTLVHHKMIETKVFLEEYWWMILKCWHILEDDIKERRNKTNGISNYMINFEEIKVKAEKYVV